MTPPVVPLWFSLAMVVDALVVGAFLQASGLGIVLAALILLGALAATLQLYHAVRNRKEGS